MIKKEYMTKALVVFSANKDKKTANMFVNGYLINEDIPLVPKYAVDHRGGALYFYAKEQNMEWEDFELDIETYKPSEIKRGFDYMFNPIYVLESVTERMSAPFRMIFGNK